MTAVSIILSSKELNYGQLQQFSIKSDGDILVDLHDSGLGSDTDLSRIASKMEIDACEKTVDEVDLVLMDGSLHSQFMTRQSALDAQVVRTMNKKRNGNIYCKNIKYKKTI